MRVDLKCRCGAGVTVEANGIYEQGRAEIMVENWQREHGPCFSFAMREMERDLADYRETQAMSGRTTKAFLATLRPECERDAQPSRFSGEPL
jgi:hypothetical protein